MLGTVSDAEDVVQDAWLRWQRVRARRRGPAGGLADHGHHPDRPRPPPVGPTAPRGLRGARGSPSRWCRTPGPDDAAVLADSLRLGFLTVLDRLKPVERAVFLLADVFSVPFAEIADTVGKSEAACRQIASRARRRVRRPASRPGPGARSGRWSMRSPRPSPPATSTSC